MAFRLNKNTKILIAIIIAVVFFGGVIGGATGTLGSFLGVVGDWFDNLLGGYF